MSLKKRIIARLDIKGSRLIKGIRFEGVRVIGNPRESAIRYYNEGIDEIFYSDAVASLYGRNSLFDLLKKTCKEVFVPVTAGGGIRSLEDAYMLLTAGADKIAINTYAVKTPELITSLASRFGEQCVVLSIQARRSSSVPSGWEVMIEAGREKTGLDLAGWIKTGQRLGAGEILLTSVDQDGTQKGPDLDLLKLINSEVHIPIILGGGFNTIKQVNEAFKCECLSGVSIGSSLHFKQLEINEIKSDLVRSNIPIRLNREPCIKYNSPILNGVEIVVIDYGMGNQQSLINAFEFLGCNVILTDDPKTIEESKVAILPGVGSFPSGIEELSQRGLREILVNRFVSGKALIGICLGMQLLFEESNEFSTTKGLGIFKGCVKNLKEHKINLGLLKEKAIENQIRLPHMGWNIVNKIEGNCEYINEKDFLNMPFYFVHSFGVEQAKELSFEAKCNYCGTTPLAICGKEKTIGFQFHPERSGVAGLNLISNMLQRLI